MAVETNPGGDAHDYEAADEMVSEAADASYMSDGQDDGHGNEVDGFGRAWDDVPGVNSTDGEPPAFYTYL